MKPTAPIIPLTYSPAFLYFPSPHFNLPFSSLYHIFSHPLPPLHAFPVNIPLPLLPFPSLHFLNPTHPHCPTRSCFTSHTSLPHFQSFPYFLSIPFPNSPSLPLLTLASFSLNFFNFTSSYLPCFPYAQFFSLSLP